MDLRGMIEESLKWLLVHATQKREQFLNVCTPSGAVKVVV
jgi:hypothetical protein